MKMRVTTSRDLFKEVDRLFTKFQEESNLLYRVAITKDEIKEVYMKNIPPIIYRERYEWDCSTCKHAIFRLALVVTIRDGKKYSFFDYVLENLEIGGDVEFFTKMFSEMAEKVRNARIETVFSVSEKLSKIGAKETLETKTGIVYSHFYGKVISKYINSKTYVSEKQGLQALLEKYATHKDVLETILYLIEEDHLYRGREKENLVKEAIKAIDKYNNSEYESIEIAAWDMCTSPAAYFNGDVIGSLAMDIFDGVDLETAIKRYNEKVAPYNYRQPKKEIVTPAQIRGAEKTLKELGIENLQDSFRFATPQDLTGCPIVWINRRRQFVTGNSLSDLLADSVKGSVPKNASEISFDEFLKLLPKAKKVEIATNIEKVTIVKALSGIPIYRWGTNIAFSYESGLADTDEVTRRVKEFGGNINAVFRASIKWGNLDDLDLHTISDYFHIYYGNKRDPKTSLELDIDMNVSKPIRGAVENIFSRGLTEKDYNKDIEIFVHNFRKREEPDDVFVNIYWKNKLVRSYKFINPPYDGKVTVCKVRFTPNGELIIKDYLTPIKTEDNDVKFVEVDAIILSPNFNEAGNKHIFFLRKGETIDLTHLRPFNVELLRPELQKHRHVMQLLSKKIQIKGKPELVGYGTSFAKERKIMVKIDGRPFKVIIKPTDINKAKEISIEELKKVA